LTISATVPVSGPRSTGGEIISVFIRISWSFRRRHCRLSAATARAISGAAVAPASMVRVCCDYWLPSVGGTKRVGRQPGCSHRDNPPIDPPDFSNGDLRTRCPILEGVRPDHRGKVGKGAGLILDQRGLVRRQQLLNCRHPPMPDRTESARRQPGDPGRRRRRVGW
jgi:hypothetical protein